MKMDRRRNEKSMGFELDLIDAKIISGELHQVLFKLLSSARIVDGRCAITSAAFARLLAIPQDWLARRAVPWRSATTIAVLPPARHATFNFSSFLPSSADPHPSIPKGDTIVKYIFLVLSNHEMI
jgi:hypothetical protein